MEIRIRTWSNQDIGLIGTLWLEAYSKLREPAPDLKTNAREALEDWLRDRVRDRACIGFIAASGDRVAGFLLGRSGTWEAEPPILKSRKLQRIDALFVVDEFRRRGVATALVERAIDHARLSGAAGIEVTFQPGDHGAQALWEGLAFRTSVSGAYRSMDA
jgi:GNAT superfamily N-acetyltransferase